MAHIHSSRNLFVRDQRAQLEKRTGGGEGTDAQRVQKVREESDSGIEQSRETSAVAVPPENGGKPDREVAHGKNAKGDEQGVLHGISVKSSLLGDNSPEATTPASLNDNSLGGVELGRREFGLFGHHRNIRFIV